jgi:hypothetical protein
VAKLLWTLKQHVGPQPRAGHAMAYDAQAGRALLFGGLATARLADTWRWDGENWTQVDDIGPNARSESAMAHDAQRQRTVLFGGTDGSAVFNDTWEWNGEDWTQVADSGPAARSEHVIAFDSARNRILLFGGAAGEAALGDTWIWDGNEWVQVENTGPARRQAAAMAFDAVRNRAVLFGGTDGTQTFNDTWEWDGTSWTQVSAFGPPPSLGATMVFTGQRALLFGGSSARSLSARLFGNSWEWDGKHWTVRQDMGPGARWGHGMVFDAGRNRGVLFGGSTAAPGAGEITVLGDTWEQFEEGGAVGPPPPPPPPGPAIVQSITADPGLQTEGQPVNIAVTLSGTPPAGSQMTVSLIDEGGNTVLEAAFQPVQPFVLPLALAAGVYTASAAFWLPCQSLPPGRDHFADGEPAVRAKRYAIHARCESFYLEPTRD